MKKAIRQFLSPPFRGVKIKATKWLRRFLPAEIVGTLTAVVCTYAAMRFTNNRVTIAFAASIAETIGFYLAIIITDAWVVRKKLKAENQSLTLKGLLLILKHIVFDFGLAELADSFLIRPFFMYIFPLWLKNYPLGVVAGKFASDLAFYIPVIISTEIRMHIAQKEGKD
jgi:hypothetical protein